MEKKHQDRYTGPHTFLALVRALLKKWRGKASFMDPNLPYSGADPGGAPGARPT